eukprot:TRINITY_DN2997_c0_g1_i2.p1 TRINITY_DN2997_c0_g1~~TRINITY_DN2997_c0_g1_i2.p1  ORF type:complete len:449 (+),score=57.07 TRINITY_DN2997_c0_g1_i2:63-1409(+)
MGDCSHPDQSSTGVTKADSKDGGHGSVMGKLLVYVKNENLDALRRLLKEHGDLVNEKDYDGRTALHAASVLGCARSAETLLELGARVNELDRRKNSPLHDAITSKSSDVATLLRRYGGEDQSGQPDHDELRIVVPPKAHRADWEIDPKEIDLRTSELIGKGSFGEIRKAQWRGTPVAVKKIIPALANDDLVVKDFRHEVDLLVRIRHPNCVQFLGAVTKQKPLLLVTEYLSGGDLHRVLKDRYPLKTSEAINFALDIARGMAYLHSGQKTVIIHRDLKPRNILVGDGDRLKVGDFGLSKLVEVQFLHDMYRLTGETGSYRYMAPEVYDHAKYDNKVDLFSYAMILFEIFEGHAPFDNLDPSEAAKCVAKQGLRPDFNTKVDYPPKMKELIQDCWRQVAAERPCFLDVIQRLEQMAEYSPRATHYFSPRAKLHQLQHQLQQKALLLGIT